jgi:hypothetical protein
MLVQRLLMGSKNTKNLCKLLGTTPLTKKAHEKSLTSIEQSLMTGSNCQAGWGKDGTDLSLGEQWLS